MSRLKDYLNRLRQGRQAAAPAPQPAAPTPSPENIRASQQTDAWDQWEKVRKERESRKSVWELNDDGYRAYRQNQYELAASLFAEAAELARQQGDTAAQAENLYWEGDTLSQDGHLKKALARLLEADSLQALDSIDQFRNLLNIVSVGRDLPLPLAEQQELLAKLEPYKGSRQIGGSRSMVLNAESFFFYDRGMYAESLARAQEAFAARVERMPFYDNKVYFANLVDSYCLVGQYEQARQILRQWQAEANYNFADEKAQILMEEAKLLYSEGSPEAAWDMIQQVYAEERYIQRAGKNSVTLLWMIRIGSELGYFEQIRPMVLQMLRFRRSESLHTRYDCYLTLARYCCHICIRGGMTSEEETRMHRHARFWLRQAEEAARTLDQLLECRWRTEEVQELRNLYTGVAN